MTVQKSEYQTAAYHDAKGTEKRKMGDVAGYTTRSFTFEVRIDPLEEYDYDGADEFLIVVNGRIVKRMNSFQAERMGLIHGRR